MAFSAHKDEKYMKEHFDSARKLEKKAKRLAELIKNSEHFVVFTGAGVSTSAGIPDFRGPQGVWTLQATGGVRTLPTVGTLQALPTPTHMSLVELQNKEMLKYLISQNCDGIHRRSGMLPHMISELHGNTNIETCVSCGKEYLRDFDASADYRTSVHNHFTGRTCSKPGCGGKLKDSIINFGENLPETPLKKAKDHSKKADLMLVLGSSLTVSPACHMPEKTADKGGKLVICNLQKTPLDDKAYLRVYAKCDELMELVMKNLDIEIPPFLLQRQMIVETTECRHQLSANEHKVKVAGIDVDGTPVSFIQALQVVRPWFKKSLILNEEPFEFSVPSSQKKVEMKLIFFGHYNEPALTISLPLENGTSSCKCVLHYNPKTGVWTTRQEQSKEEDEEEDRSEEDEVKSPSETNQLENGMNGLSLGATETDGKKEGTPVPLSVIVGNSDKKLERTDDGRLHEWTVYVKGAEDFDISSAVDKVEFELNDTFSPKTVTISTVPFELTRTGKGRFPVGIKIFFKSGEVKELQHKLSFKSGGKEKAHSLTEE